MSIIESQFSGKGVKDWLSESVVFVVPSCVVVKTNLCAVVVIYLIRHNKAGFLTSMFG